MTEQKRAAVEYTQEELETMVKAVLNGATIGQGEGHSKKEAEQNAARAAIGHLEHP